MCEFLSIFVWIFLPAFNFGEKKLTVRFCKEFKQNLNLKLIAKSIPLSYKLQLNQIIVF